MIKLTLLGAVLLLTSAEPQSSNNYNGQNPVPSKVEDVVQSQQVITHHTVAHQAMHVFSSVLVNGVDPSQLLNNLQAVSTHLSQSTPNTGVGSYFHVTPTSGVNTNTPIATRLQSRVGEQLFDNLRNVYQKHAATQNSTFFYTTHGNNEPSLIQIADSPTQRIGQETGPVVNAMNQAPGVVYYNRPFTKVFRTIVTKQNSQFYVIGPSNQQLPVEPQSTPNLPVVSENNENSPVEDFTPGNEYRQTSVSSPIVVTTTTGGESLPERRSSLSSPIMTITSTGRDPLPSRSGGVIYYGPMETQYQRFSTAGHSQRHFV